MCIENDVGQNPKPYGSEILKCCKLSFLNLLQNEIRPEDHIK